MPFDSGRVTLCRFAVEGDAPTGIDPTTIDTLNHFAFKETPIGSPDEIEAGWTTGEHLFDTQFTYEKNGFGNMLLFALRIDTNKVPSEVRHAYKRINELAAASGNPSGFASRAQKRDAADLANRQVHEDLAAGKFRRSKTLPVLWDLQRRELYLGAANNVAIEQLCSKFHESFNAELVPITSGSLASRMLQRTGRTRDHEDLKPSAFTEPPAQFNREVEGTGPDLNLPHVPWVRQTIEMKDFVGNEFLMWLWWLVETDEGMIEITLETGKNELAVMIDKTLEMECAWGATGLQSLRADGPTRLPEVAAALSNGKWPRKAGLTLADTADSKQWQFNFQADRFIVGSAALPEIPDAQTPREVVEQRLLLIRELVMRMDGLFDVFLKQRVSSQWQSQREVMRQWIAQRGRPRVVTTGANVPAPRQPVVN